jgi:acetyl-CoA C-acetyltransferase
VQREVVIVSGVRTAIGKFGGSLKDVPPTELAAVVVRPTLRSALAWVVLWDAGFANSMEEQ